MNGSCLCGAVVFEVAAAPRAASTCHALSSAQVDLVGSAIAGPVRWYAATKSGKRGFGGRVARFCSGKRVMKLRSRLPWAQFMTPRKATTMKFQTACRSFEF